ncbi:MAG TPA: hypothetical protein VF337_12075 [Candidatus Limnocylindrales bacterium]
MSFHRTTARSNIGVLGIKAAFVTAVAVSALALAAGPAAAAAPPAFNNIPSTLPGNVASIGFEATGTSEFGDYIILGGTERSRAALPVTVVMSSWACQSDATVGGVCTTTPGATFAQPLTLTIYSVTHPAGGVPTAGPVVLQIQHTFQIPYRPSYDPSGTCKSPRWQAADGGCYSGMATPVTFTLPAGDNLPDELIWTISFNTGSSGYAPTGDQKLPYNSLNVSAETDIAPSAGSEGDPDGLFINSRTSSMYGSGASVNTFGFTTGWTANKPMSCLGTSCTVSAPAPSESVLAETAAPIESIAGETSVPNPVTPPPTSEGGSSSSTPGPQFALILCTGFAAAALIAVGAQRRSLRR